jgi:asparagine synthase (glutamine-hydrolysing)
MCGISGSIAPGREQEGHLRKSIAAISHRGPDEEGYFFSPECSLGMCRLSIVDITNGQQPNFNLTRSVVSVFNGEIYNFLELKSLLRSKGVAVDAAGDSALIPYLYEVYGEKFPSLLQGMFAIAVFDINQKKLLLIRDRIGKKPLWYSINNSTLHFSSELKGLFSLGVSKEAETKNFSEYLRFGYVNAPRSAYKNIFQIPPASIMTFQHGAANFSRYWDTTEVKEISISFPDALAETERILREAVRARLVSERPIGAFLSGGIDSTLVSTLMQQESSSDVHTFSIGFTDPKYDESKFAKSVARAIGTVHHEKVVFPEPDLIIGQLARVLDQPFADSSIIPTYLLSRFAREHLVVALSGDGGDEAFAGYERYRAGNFLDAINPLLVMNPLRFVPAVGIKNSRARKLLKHSRATSLVERYRGFQSLFEKRDLSNLMQAHLVSHQGVDNFEETWNSIPTTDRIRRMQEMDIKTYLPGDLMLKVDLASMANSLEVRSPFLDYRVIEFGLSLPSSYKLRKGQSKYILKELARRYVPSSLIDRPKMGFGIPRARWLREDLKSMVWDILLDETSKSRGWFQQDKVRKVLIQHQSGFHLDSIIWPIFMLELWARNWLD